VEVLRLLKKYRLTDLRATNALMDNAEEINIIFIQSIEKIISILFKSME